MEYRNWNTPAAPAASTSLLGFGCMRLPLAADGSIDTPRAAALLQRARKAGVNYFDTAYNYHGGASEAFVGSVVANWPRESFYLATKLPVWKCDTLATAQQIFDEQRQRLGVEYLDFYLMHALNRERYDQARALGIVDWLWQQKQTGRIRRLGFSFHDNYEAFVHIVNDQPWDFCQIQYNYIDTDDKAGQQAGQRAYELCEQKGLPLVIMEPVKGGTLAALPAEAAAPLQALRPAASMASWALRWVASHPNVHVVLSGMSDEAQLEDNLATFGRFAPLSKAESQAVDSAATVLRSRLKIGCTGCRYCMPCPAGVDIPGNFAIWNHLGMFGQPEAARTRWARMEAAAKAQNCVRCGKCESLCPQQLPIREALAQLQQQLDAL